MSSAKFEGITPITNLLCSSKGIGLFSSRPKKGSTKRLNHIINGSTYCIQRQLISFFMIQIKAIKHTL